VVVLLPDWVVVVAGVGELVVRGVVTVVDLAGATVVLGGSSADPVHATEATNNVDMRTRRI
jgi:hypothetical protein